MRKRIAVLTGAGISAESGLKTFRDSGGLWEEYKVEDVASYDGWLRDPSLVIDFYNQRRKQLEGAKPNAAHIALARLEQKYDVDIITQNVDDLHERGGSSHILHLHGELTKVRSSRYRELVYSIGYKSIKMGDLCERGAQLRPHIVWFGEEVPLIADAARLIERADIMLVIGTSLQVYPAAGLIHYAPKNCRVFFVDPGADGSNYLPNLVVIKEGAGKAVPLLVEQLLNEPD